MNQNQAEKAKHIIATLLARVLWVEIENYNRRQIKQRFINKFNKKLDINIDKTIDYMIESGIIECTFVSEQTEWDENDNIIFGKIPYYSVKQ